MKSEETDLNWKNLTETAQKYVQSMVSWAFEIIEITHVIVWNQVLVEIIFTLKQGVNRSSVGILKRFKNNDNVFMVIEIWRLITNVVSLYYFFR